MGNSTIPYPVLNTNTLIGYYRQKTKSIREIPLDHLKLQKEYSNAFQSMWIEYIKTSVDNYLPFQYNMIMLYVQMCNGYSKNMNLMQNVL